MPSKENKSTYGNISDYCPPISKSDDSNPALDKEYDDRHDHLMKQFKTLLCRNTSFHFLVWGVTLIGAIATLFAPKFAGVITFFCYLVAFLEDRKFLRASGGWVPHWGWFFLAPVYILRRQQLNHLPLVYFWGHILMWIVSNAAALIILQAIYR